MTSAARLRRDETALQDMAARLIEALGKDGAIFVCRSNYWHGILRLILDRPVPDVAA